MKIPYLVTLFGKKYQNYFTKTILAETKDKTQELAMERYPAHDYTITDIRPFYIDRFCIVMYDARIPNHQGVLVHSSGNRYVTEEILQQSRSSKEHDYLSYEFYDNGDDDVASFRLGQSADPAYRN